MRGENEKYFGPKKFTEKKQILPIRPLRLTSSLIAVKIWTRFYYSRTGFRIGYYEKSVDVVNVVEDDNSCSVCEVLVYSGLLSVIIYIVT